MIIHGHIFSPPAKAASSLAKHLGYEFTDRTVDLLNGEHKGEAFLKMSDFATL